MLFERTDKEDFIDESAVFCLFLVVLANLHAANLTADRL